MESLDIALHELIRRIRAQARRRGWKLADLARSAGIDAGKFSKWERQEAVLRFHELLNIARALNVPVSTLTDGERPQPVLDADERLVLESYRVARSRGIASGAAAQLILGAVPAPSSLPAPARELPQAETGDRSPAAKGRRKGTG